MMALVIEDIKFNLFNPEEFTEQIILYLIEAKMKFIFQDIFSQK
ncbi:hypothetical protein NEF87_004879 [Candidatus Lokiarchaeum ossiferum]|uniref:Uncharacterized protein n=1 Tax=Candidatus Lokiarchaeum ossiferum TaxID=2951803 RepID=A0ABY6HYI6_9ARCH|nr:hypothetical protein NEF87_004879 [Candidatus Lokiarchaeum sp. B-35]